MKNRIFALIMCLSLVLVLAACSGSGSEAQSGYAFMTIKDEKSLSIEEVGALIEKYGLPATEFHGAMSSRDITR